MESNIQPNSKILLDDISHLKSKILTIEDVYNFALENSKSNI